MTALEGNPTAKSLTILACFFVAYAIRTTTFLGLLNPIYPFTGVGHQLLAVLSNALVSTCLVSWIVFYSTRRRRTVANLILVFLAAQITLTAYAILGWQLDATWVNAWPLVVETGWLGFIFGIYPPICLLLALLLFFFQWKKGAGESR